MTVWPPRALDRVAAAGAVILIAGTAVAGVGLPLAPSPPLPSARVQAVAQKVQARVVGVRAERRTRSPGARASGVEALLARALAPEYEDRLDVTAIGSGAFLRSGLVVTNHHVVDGAERLVVIRADGTERLAAVRGADEALDVAVLEVAGGDDLGPLAVAPAESVAVGASIIVVGSFFGL